MVIQSRLVSPDWDEARCAPFPIRRDEDGLVRTDAWFQQAEDAVSVCNGEFSGSPCPIRAACLEFALVNNDQNGVWGGMTGPQRRWIRRNVPRAMWHHDEHLREVTPPPDYFADYGDEDPDQDEEDFQRERRELAEKRARGEEA